MVEAAAPRARRLIPPGARLAWVALAILLVVTGGILLTAIRFARGPIYPVADTGETLIWVSTYNNRGIAYLRRGEAGDLDRAIADLTRVIVALPDDATAYNNRGAVYLERRAAGDLLRAVRDFTRAIDLMPKAHAAYFNRGLAYFALGEAYDGQSLADLRRARTLQPDAPGPNNALCWQLSLLGRPEEALPYCEAAVATDPTAMSRDSRGLAYALLGRTAEAVADFEAFLAWLDTQPEKTYQRYGPRRQAWLEALRAGRNPFHTGELRSLRSE